jgi:glutamine synthetase
MPAMSLVYNPSINAYKRLVPGFFAPVTASWGLDNRTVAVRAVSGQDAGSTHLELRRAGADANPYLVLAAAVACALAGIEQRLPAPAAVSGDAALAAGAELLPSSLEASLVAFRADAEARAMLGARFSQHFAATRAWELSAWQQAVTDWECARVEGPGGWAPAV